MRNLRLVFLFVLALVVLAPVVTAQAEDAPTGVVVSWQDGETPTVVVEDQSSFDAVWLLAIIPGVIAVLAIVAQVIESKNYRQTIENISADNLNKLEGALEQVPQAVVSQIHAINEKLIVLAEGALATLRVVDTVTDGKPNTTTLESALRRAVGDPPAMG